MQFPSASVPQDDIKMMELALMLHKEVGVTCGNCSLLVEAFNFMWFLLLAVCIV